MFRVQNILLGFLVLVISGGCTLMNRNPSDPVKLSKKKKREQTQAVSGKEESSTTEEVSAAPTPAGCQPISKSDFKAPYLLSNYPVFVTRLLKACNDSFDKSSSWTAMGVPCSQGNGLVRWTDKYVAPKLVTFHMTNACPMLPTDLMKLSTEVNSQLGLDETARLLSFAPISIQFWEIEGQPEMDTGYEVEFRNPASLGPLWAKVREGQPLPVIVYGRENSWFQNGPMFAVKGEIVVYQRNSFRFDPKELKVLEQADKDQVRSKCEKVRPRTTCAGIFD